MGEEEMYAAPANPTSEPLEQQEEVQRVRRAIRTLRVEEQEIFLLRENGELTYEQIAESDIVRTSGAPCVRGSSDASGNEIGPRVTLRVPGPVKEVVVDVDEARRYQAAVSI